MLQVARHCFLLATLVAFFLSPALGAEECKRSYVVGVSDLSDLLKVSADGSVSGPYYTSLQRSSAHHGCLFSYKTMPRARALHYFEHGDEIDILPAAVRSPVRDALGDFVPVSRSKVVLVSLKPVNADAWAELEKGNFRLLVVRGYDYGPSYRDLLSRLKERGQALEVKDVDTVATMLLRGRAEASILPATAIYSAWRDSGASERLELTDLPMIPPIDAGYYLSRQRLGEDERSALRRQLQLELQSGDFWREYQRLYPDWILKNVGRLNDADPRN